jgi:hypothetical protein
MRRALLINAIEVKRGYNKSSVGRIDRESLDV